MPSAKLYFLPMSPPARLAYITSKAIGYDVELVSLNLFAHEHLTEEFKKLNPAQTIPTLVDDDTTVADSTAISLYLIEKYAKDDSLYPKKDFNLRTKINQILFYHASYLFPRLFNIFVPIMRNGETGVPKDKMDGIYRGYGTLEKYLEGGKYLCGNQLTLGDLAVWTTLGSLKGMVPIDDTKYPKLIEWLNRMDTLPYSKINIDGSTEHIKMFNDLIAKNLAAKK